ncbi:hypothetical protein Pen01_78490 [Phytomonospora endophytica]|nr:hypothetical protein Pen01_78490 [Phytomonospora endophytica]
MKDRTGRWPHARLGKRATALVLEKQRYFRMGSADSATCRTGHTPSIATYSPVPSVAARSRRLDAPLDDGNRERFPVVARTCRRWSDAGVFDALQQVLLAELNAAGRIDWTRGGRCRSRAGKRKIPDVT